VNRALDGPSVKQALPVWMFLTTNIIPLEALSQMRKCRQANIECSDPRIDVHKHKVINIYFLLHSFPRLSTSRVIPHSHCNIPGIQAGLPLREACVTASTLVLSCPITDGRI
jgi:hypothetical protein